jgi:hypothetical protein
MIKDGFYCLRIRELRHLLYEARKAFRRAEQGVNMPAIPEV